MTVGPVGEFNDLCQSLSQKLAENMISGLSCPYIFIGLVAEHDLDNPVCSHDHSLHLGHKCYDQSTFATELRPNS